MLGFHKQAKRGVELRISFFQKPWNFQDHIFKKNSWSFWICYFTLENSGQKKALPLKIPESCYTSWKCQIFIAPGCSTFTYYFCCFIINFVIISYVLLSVSVVNMEQVMACNGESHALLTKYFGVRLPYGPCFPYWQVCASVLFGKKVIRFIQTLVHHHL